MSKQCKYCGAEMDDKAYECPECLKKIPGAEIAAKQLEIEKKQKRKMVLTVSLISLAFIALITGIVMLVMAINQSASDRYKKPIDNYVDALRYNKYQKYLSAFPDYMSEFLDNSYASIMGDEDGEMYLNEMYKTLLSTYGEDFKVTYSITSEARLDKEALDTYVSEIDTYFGEDKNRKVTDGYDVTVVYYAEGYKLTQKFTKLTTLLEVNDEWCIVDFVDFLTAKPDADEDIK